MRGFIIAAPGSHCGKTLLTLALLRLLKQRGVEIRAAKAGPDYLDPAFHRAALAGAGQSEEILPDQQNSSNTPPDTTLSCNLDGWAMRPALLRALAAGAGPAAGGVLAIEAMMGLFDGAATGSGSAADLAQALGLPVILVLDCRYMSQSVAALAQGFCNFAPDLKIAGLILNKVAGDRHEAILRAALAAVQQPKPLPPVLAVMRRHADLHMPERHLGLVQAGEQPQLEAFIYRAAELLAQGLDDRLLMEILNGRPAAGAEPATETTAADLSRLSLPLPLPGRHIAIAYDNAFRFVYPHFLAAWRAAGRRLSFFSPLADETPAAGADCVFLPGGYPELYAAELAGAARFKAAMRAFAAGGGAVYGECGGYMTLGEAIYDRENRRHAMLGLLPIATDFSCPRLHLGYRRLMAQTDFFGAGKQAFRGHEFHYAGFASGADEAALWADTSGELKPLFQAFDSQGAALGHAGLARGAVCGSFMHIIDCEG